MSDEYKEPLFQASGQTVPIHCDLCGCLTGNLGTKLCDRCCGLKIRVEADPELAQQIIDNMDMRE